MGLGHTMLRTTRESQIERQPASLDGQFWITADARIDCREELEEKLAQLRAAKRRGRAATDSELILRAYAAWGAECVQHLRGDFAFAIWDAQQEIAVLRARSFRREALLLFRTGRAFSFQQHARLLCASIPTFPRN